MAKKHTPIDGVVQRTQNRSVADFTPVNTGSVRRDKFKRTNPPIGFKNALKSNTMIGASTTPDDQDMKNTESGATNTTMRARRRARRVAKKQKLARKPKWYRAFRKSFRFVGAAVVVFALILGAKSWLALSNIIDRDGALAFTDFFNSATLDGEEDGRVNIMLVGIGGETHTAGDLADSILIASINTRDNKLALLSVPRDLYVDIPGYWSSRINAAHSIGEEQGYPGGGVALLEKTIEDSLDIPIHYYARVDFGGFTQAIDAVGGVTINLEEPVYDNNFDWQFGPDALRLPAGDVTLNGTTALLLSRARGAGSASYGLSGSDFSRTEHQRQILLALKDKILSVGTFSNPLKLSSLIDAAGKNAKTDLEISEMLRVKELLDNIPEDSYLTTGLSTAADSYLTGANIGGASVLVPRAGDFSDIQNFVENIFTVGFLKKEEPLVDVLNGSEIYGAATEASYTLEDYGLTINLVANAPTTDYTQTVIYDVSNNSKPFTRSILEKEYGVSIQDGSQLPAGISTLADFVVIIGNDETTTN